MIKWEQMIKESRYRIEGNGYVIDDYKVHEIVAEARKEAFSDGLNLTSEAFLGVGLWSLILAYIKGRFKRKMI